MVAVVTESDHSWRFGGAGADPEQQVVAAGLQLARPEDLDLEVVTLRDAVGFLCERVGGALVGRGVLPFARSVGGLSVALRREHLRLAAAAKPRQHDLVDLASPRRLAGPPGPARQGRHRA